MTSILRGLERLDSAKRAMSPGLPHDDHQHPRACTNSTKRQSRAAVVWMVRKPSRHTPTPSLTARWQPQGQCASSLMAGLLLLPYGYLSGVS